MLFLATDAFKYLLKSSFMFNERKTKALFEFLIVNSQCDKRVGTSMTES